jgi:hypothetical protein
MDMRFGTWNVRSLYRIGSLMTVVRELGKCKLDLVGVQEVRWEKGGTEWAEDYTFFYVQENGYHHLGTGFFVRKRIELAVRRVEFISDRVSYIILRGRWCNIILFNVHAPCIDKGDVVKDSFYDMKILLGDFNAKVGRENIFKQTIGNDCLHESSNDSGVRVVNFATSKNLVVKSTMFLHRKIHKYTWASPEGKIHNQIDDILIHRRRHSSILDV